MTRRERMTAIFRGDVPDRPAIKLWGADPYRPLPHSAYEAIRDLALAKTDLAIHKRSPFNLHFGARQDEFVNVSEVPGESPDWVDDVMTVETPEGNLRSVFQRSTKKRPGYRKEYMLKEPEDIRKILSLPYEPCHFDVAPFHEGEEKMGDAGIVIFSLDHAAYGLQRLIGSENFALWSLDHAELMLEAVSIFAERIREEARRALASGLGPVFGWVGPELVIPPLMSPADFDRYVGAFDKPLIDLIHDGGGHVWVHSHGRMAGMLERFVDLGIDVLNPIEPPPMGDVTLAEAFAVVGDRMGLEGNIETHDMMTASREELGAKIHAALDAGRGRRHILCPSSGYCEDAQPTQQLLDNLVFYIEESLRYVSAFQHQAPE